MNQAVTKPTLVAPIATPAGAVLATASISATGPVPTTHVYKSSLDCFFTVSLCDGQVYNFFSHMKCVCHSIMYNNDHIISQTSVNYGNLVRKCNG